MSATTVSFKSALRFAGLRAAAVVWGGMVALGLYLMMISIGPQLEGQIAPVVTNYEMREVEPLTDGFGFSFVSRFFKARDCTAFGTSWFAPDENGDLVKINAIRLDGTPSAPQTGPTGWRIGSRQALYIPENAPYVIAIINHDCGFVWQTRTTLGPFPLLNGMPIGFLPTP